MKKINLRAWCSYPIMVNEDVEVASTDRETLEAKLAEICERIINESRPMPAVIDGPEFTEL
jgi:hypothetical protein